MPTSAAETNAPTAAAIKKMLRAKLGRQWRVGDRLPPMKELARQLGRGQTNTHQAVRELAAEGLLESRQRRGTYVLRTPEPETSFDNRRKRTTLEDVTVQLYFCSNPPAAFVQRMIDSFRELIGPTRAQIQTNSNSLPSIRDYRDDPADVIVLFNPGSAFPLTFNPNQLVSVVTTAARMEIEGSNRYDVVSIDELHGGMVAGRVLRSSGCRGVCFLGRGQPPNLDRCDQTSALRLLGFENAWGAAVARENILLRHGYSPQAGGELFRRYMQLGKSRPNGIFAASDDLAVGFIGAAAAHDMLPVRDYQIVGFDGQEAGQVFSGGSLTTVKVPASEMGRRAAQLLLERIAEPDRPAHRVQLECDLHRGFTTNIPSLENPS